jgi:hypothetical protein
LKFFTENTVYEGYFKDNLFDGEGFLFFKINKCYFKGFFRAGKKLEGVELFPNGD